MISKAEQEYVRIIGECTRHRKLQGITQANVGESMGIYQQDICKMETCRHIPNMVKFLEYLDSIGLKVELKEV